MMMNRCWAASALALIAGSAFAVGPEIIPGELVVKFKPGYSANLAAQSVGARVVASTTNGLSRLRLPAAVSVDNGKTYFSRLSSVEFAEPNFVRRAFTKTPNDPGYTRGNQWYLWPTVPPSNFSSGVYRPNFPTAWTFTQGADDIVVAVIDTGVDYVHLDLGGNGKDNKLADNPHMFKGADVVGDGDDDPKDENGHGTHVAGIIGALTNNGIGVAGVAWKVKIMPVRVLDKDGVGSSFDIAEGIEYAAQNGAKILNLSLGGYGASYAEYSAVNNAYQGGRGALVVAAAGNDALSTNNLAAYPANFPGVLSVGATSMSDRRAYFSNYGPGILVAAPGEQIYSTYLHDKGEYMWEDGTSMASPVVAGLAAILWQQVRSQPLAKQGSFPTNPAGYISSLIQRNTRYVGSWVKKGRIDAVAAMRDALQTDAIKKNATALAAVSGWGTGSGSTTGVKTAGDNLFFTVTPVVKTGLGRVAEYQATFGNLGIQSKIAELNFLKLRVRATAVTGGSGLLWVKNVTKSTPNNTVWDSLPSLPLAATFSASAPDMVVDLPSNFRDYISNDSVVIRSRSILPARINNTSYLYKTDYLKLEVKASALEGDDNN